jgi:Flp pilus assembly protein TadG
MSNNSAERKRSTVRKISEYFKGTSGNVATFFALALPVTLVAIGAALDTARITREYSTFHAAIDSAAFAIAQDNRSATSGGQISQTNIDGLKVLAKKYISSNYSAEAGFSGEVTVDVAVTGQQVRLNANIDFPTTLMQLVGIESVSMSAESVVEKAMRPIEMVLVMDTTGSMSADIASARQSAKDFLQTVYGSSSTSSEYLRIALVPFAAAVRLDPSTPGVLDWIDTNGSNLVSRANFTQGVLNNYTAWGALKKSDGSSHTWNGCVEARQRHNADPSLDFLTNDAAPNPAVGATKFPAYFNPDAPSFNGSTTESYRDHTTGTSRTNRVFYEPYNTSINSTYNLDYSTNNYINSFYDVTIPQSGSPVRGTLDSSDRPAPVLPIGYPLSGTTPLKDVQNSGTSSDYNILHHAVTPPATGREVSGVGYGANYMTRLTNDYKYQNAIVAAQTYSGTTSSAGPWVNCAASSVVPMTHDRTKIEAGLDAMRAAGGTNIMEGIAWGMRAISQGEPYSTVDSSPLGPGALISNYNDIKWQKIIVLMSDGENDPGLSSSSANVDIGRSYNAYGRSTLALATGLNRYGTIDNSGATLQAVMNADTLKICTNLKNNGVQIYSIGFRLDSALLKSCATDDEAPYYSYADSTTSLAAVFNHIGEDVLNKMVYVSK